MTIIALPASPNVSVRGERFRLRRAEEAIETNSGISQITTWPSRLWVTQIDVVPMHGANLRAWALFALQLSTLSNAFAYGPPHYSGPSTGYAGSAPLVNGANQLGMTLNVDGLANSSAILLAGDFFSFDVTSPGGTTNRQLNAVTANVNSNGSGQAAFPLLLPIRQAPANDAAVNIATPTALFRLVAPENGIDLDIDSLSPFAFDAIEMVSP